MCQKSLRERYMNFYNDYATKNLATLTEDPVALQEAVFERFFQQVDITQFTPEEQRDYREIQKDFWDFCSVTETYEKKGLKKGMEKGMKEGIKKGLKEGMENGMEKGMEKGRKTEKIEIARTMKSMGMSVDVVANATGLSPEEIEEL